VPDKRHGYSLGTTFAPKLDGLAECFYHGNPVERRLAWCSSSLSSSSTAKNGLAMTHGGPPRSPHPGSRPLSKASLDFVVN